MLTFSAMRTAARGELRTAIDGTVKESEAVVSASM